MAGFFGADFDPTKPEEEDQVRRGAGWIRDIKTRLKNSMSVLLSLETGEFKPSSVDPEALANVPGLTAGTWRQFVVDNKGRVTLGTNPTQLTSVPGLYRGTFSSVGAVYDTPSGLVVVAAPSLTPYTAGSEYSKVYENTGSGVGFRRYDITIPDKAEKLLVKAIGGGGGGYEHATNNANGAHGEYREATMAVTPGTNLEIFVGDGGGSNATTPISGCTTKVKSGSVFMEAAGGGAASASTGGPPQTGARSSLGTGHNFVVPGYTGDVPGGSGTTFVDARHYHHKSSVTQYGQGGIGGTGGNSSNGQDGLVVLEWFI